MEITIFKNKTSNLLYKSLQVYNKQHKAISKNVANVNNPFYKRTKTDFSDLLVSETEKQKLKSTDTRHILKPNYNTDDIFSDKKTEKVDITNEMTELAENQIRHEFATKRYNGFFNAISTAIRGRNQ